MAQLQLQDRTPVLVLFWFSIVLLIGGGELPAFGMLNERVLYLLNTLSFNLDISQFEGGANSGSAEFCRKLFEAFRKQDKVLVIYPVVTTQRFEDPSLQRFLKTCPKLRPHRREAFMRPSHDFPQVSYGTRNFRLYQLDLDGDPSTREDLLFYSERFYAPDIDRVAMEGGMYQGVDLSACEYVDYWVETGSNIESNKESTITTNGVINYDGKYYVYDFTAFAAADAHEFSLFALTKGQPLNARCRFWGQYESK